MVPFNIELYTVYVDIAKFLLYRRRFSHRNQVEERSTLLFCGKGRRLYRGSHLQRTHILQCHISMRKGKVHAIITIPIKNLKVVASRYSSYVQLYCNKRFPPVLIFSIY